MQIIETHCHLNHEGFAEDLPQVMQRARKAGVAYFMNVGWDVPSSEAAVKQAVTHPDMGAVVGIHPHDADTACDENLHILATLAARDEVVAWGEIGLDYHYDNSPRELQRQAFSRQLDIVKALNMPVVIHSREATADTLTILRQYAPLRGVMHCFSGSWETAEICIGWGLYIGFAGPVTFKNARRLREVAAKVPSERIVVETDCPYLSPEPLRGKRNEPANLIHVLAHLGEIKGWDSEEAARITTDNARRVFQLD